MELLVNLIKEISPYDKMLTVVFDEELGEPGYYMQDLNIIKLESNKKEPFSILVAVHEAFHRARHLQGVKYYYKFFTSMEDWFCEELTIDELSLEFCCRKFPEMAKDFVKILNEKWPETPAGYYEEIAEEVLMFGVPGRYR